VHPLLNNWEGELLPVCVADSISPSQQMRQRCYRLQPGIWGMPSVSQPPYVLSCAVLYCSSCPVLHCHVLFCHFQSDLSQVHTEQPHLLSSLLLFPPLLSPLNAPHHTTPHHTTPHHTTHTKSHCAFMKESKPCACPSCSSSKTCLRYQL
jgi:hypothetical protein